MTIRFSFIIRLPDKNKLAEYSRQVSANNQPPGNILQPRPAQSLRRSKCRSCRTRPGLPFQTCDLHH
jgi:hypothetical protein